MTRVWVVATVHAEQGRASGSRLHAILERLEPEVIFLELPLADLGDFLHGTRSNLESTAVRKYQENREVVLVPVDLPEPDEGFFRAIRDLQRNKKMNSSRYRRLMDENTRCVERPGFSYLNSQRCGQAWSEINEEIGDTVEWLDNRRGFHRIVAALRSTSHGPPCTSVAKKQCSGASMSIFAFSPSREVFLIGAAYRRPILTRAQERTGADLPRIEGDRRGFSDALGE